MGRLLVVVVLGAAFGAGPAATADAAATGGGLGEVAPPARSVGSSTTVHQAAVVHDVTTPTIVPQDGPVLVVDRAAESRRRWITAGTLAVVGALGAVSLGMVLAARRAEARAARDTDGLEWLYAATSPTAGARMPADAAPGARAEDDFWWTGRTAPDVVPTPRPAPSEGRPPEDDDPGRAGPSTPEGAPAGPVRSRTVRLISEHSQPPGRRAR